MAAAAQGPMRKGETGDHVTQFCGRYPRLAHPGVVLGLWSGAGRPRERERKIPKRGGWVGGAGLADLVGGGGPRQVGRGQDGVVRSRRSRSGLSEPGRGGRRKRRSGRMGEWANGGMATQGAELRVVRSIVVTGGGNGESPLSAPRTAARGVVVLVEGSATPSSAVARHRVLF